MKKLFPEWQGLREELGIQKYPLICEVLSENCLECCVSCASFSLPAALGFLELAGWEVACRFVSRSVNADMIVDVS